MTIIYETRQNSLGISQRTRRCAPVWKISNFFSFLFKKQVSPAIKLVTPSPCTCTCFQILLIELFQFIVSAKVFVMLLCINKNSQTRKCDLGKINASCLKKSRNRLLKSTTTSRMPWKPDDELKFPVLQWKLNLPRDGESMNRIESKMKFELTISSLSKYSKMNIKHNDQRRPSWGDHSRTENEIHFSFPLRQRFNNLKPCP